MRRLIIGLLMLAGIIGAGSYARAQAMSADELAELRAIIEGTTAELFAPGDPVPGWNESGADLFAALAAAPGGATANVLLGTDSDGERSATFHGTMLADVPIPANWTVVKESGIAPARTPDISTFIMPLDGPLVIAAESAVIRSGKAICGRGLGHYRVYRVPGRPGGELPEAAALMMTDVLDKAMADRLLCETYEPITDGFRVRGVNGDGRALPKLDAKEPDMLRIVPRAPIDQLLFGGN